MRDSYANLEGGGGWWRVSLIAFYIPSGYVLPFFSFMRDGGSEVLFVSKKVEVTSIEAPYGNIDGSHRLIL